MNCPRCRTDLANDSFACPACGLVQAQDGAFCGCDRTAHAQAVCIVCGIPVCGSCGEEADGRSYCTASAHHRFFSEHVRVRGGLPVFESDWMLVNLRQRGVEAVALEAGSHAGLRPPSRDGGSVYVPKADAERAEQILSLLEPKETA